MLITSTPFSNGTSTRTVTFHPQHRESPILQEVTYIPQSMSGCLDDVVHHLDAQVSGTVLTECALYRISGEMQLPHSRPSFTLIWHAGYVVIARYRSHSNLMVSKDGARCHSKSQKVEQVETNLRAWCNATVEGVLRVVSSCDSTFDIVPWEPMSTTMSGVSPS
jgi:hypothetical protein